MLAGFSSIEAATHFQASHVTSMSTQRLDFPCNLVQKDFSRPHSIRPVGSSIDKPINQKTSSCSLKHTREAQDVFFKKGTSLKRFAEEEEESHTRAKRKRVVSISEDCFHYKENLSLFEPGSGGFCFQPSFELPKSFSLNTSQIPFSLSTPLPIQNNICMQEPLVSSSSSERDSHIIAVNPSQGANLATTHYPNRSQQDGFELVSLLVACVEAIGSKNIAGVNYFIAKLGDLASPKGSSIRRLIAYFTEGLALRVTRIWPHVFHLTPPREFHREDDDSGSSLMLFNQISPIPKFIHFTSNEIILKAFEGKDRVHIIDFDIKQGLQWPSLFQSLATRANPPSHVRITGIGESKQGLIETGYRLAGLAEDLNLTFEFHSVVDRLEDVRLWMLHVKESESVAVNCVFQLHKLLYDGRNGKALRDFLGLIRSTNPSVFVLAEQETEHNEVAFEMRLINSLKYYSAIFDSIDTTCLRLDSPIRMKIEEAFGREIRNIIACEGYDRFERHEKFETWWRLMTQEGFRGVGVSEIELCQSKMILKMFCLENFRVGKQEENGNGITLSWLDQPLYTVSAWKAVDNI